MGRSATAVLVHPDRAAKQLDEAGAETAPEDEAPAETDEEGPTLPTRYYGVTGLDPVRAVRDLGQILDEVVQHLGSSVELTLEVKATGDGYDERTQRTVRENSNQLGFDTAEFE